MPRVRIIPGIDLDRESSVLRSPGPSPDPEGSGWSRHPLLDQALSRPFDAPTITIPSELLVATVLSAQCTDERVNRVTPALFARYPDPRAMAQGGTRGRRASRLPDGVLPRRRKSDRPLESPGGAIMAKFPPTLKHSRRCQVWGARRPTWSWETRFDRLGGRGRHPREAACVRLGLTAQTDPVPIEHELNRLIPKRHWIDFSHRLIAVTVERSVTPFVPVVAIAP